MASPFRDELETLRQENERLRHALERAQPHRVSVRLGLALGLTFVDIGAAMMMRPWLNGESDGHFWGALGVLGAIAVCAGVAAVGYRRG